MTALLERRRKAAQRTLDRFKDKPFQPGRRDCAQMAKWHLRTVGRPIRHVARAGSYHSIAGGVKQLRKLGYADLPAVMDAHFPRIAPAKAVVGDIVALPGEDGPGALTVAMGNGRVLGYHQDSADGVVMQPSDFEAAWRILPLPGEDMTPEAER